MKNFNSIINENTSAYLDDQQRLVIIDKLKNALREEINAWFGYIMITEWLQGKERKNIEEFYKEAAEDELEDHAYWIMQRINQLGGTIEDITCNMNSMNLANHSYLAPIWIDGGIDIKTSLLTNIENERGAIETYKELVDLTNDIDPVSNCKLKEILADEEEHLIELTDFLKDIE